MEHSVDTAQKKGIKDDCHSPIQAIFDKFAKRRDVTLIYGEPIKHERRTVVPVAKMRYSFGAGSGKEINPEDSDEESQEQEGEGGGGHFTVKPLGVYDMTASRVRFKPAIDVPFILTIFSVFSLGAFFLLRKSDRL